MTYIGLVGSSPSAINIVAITWSTLSIISSIFAFFTTKTIQGNNEYIVVSFEVRNNSDDINYKNARCNNNKLISPIAKVLNANIKSVSIMKPELMGMGLKLKFIINTNSYMVSERGTIYENHINNAYKKVNEYKSKMDDPQKLKPLINTINKQWGLTNQDTIICNISVDFVSSMKRNDTTSDIQSINPLKSNQETIDTTISLDTDALINYDNTTNAVYNVEGI